MSYPATIITVFISSPGDVQSERQFVLNEMQSWNQRNSREKGCFLNARTWEDVVAPDRDTYSQNVINRQIGDSYDVFLGIMWSRFGTPTQSAQSGTEEEYDRAISRNDSGEFLSVSFFFKTSDVPMDKIDGDQISKIAEFKKKIAEAGCFYKDFREENQLSRGLDILFDHIAKRVDDYPVFDSRKLEIHVPNITPDTEKHIVVHRSEDIALDEPGLFDLNDALELSTTAFVALIGEWADEIQILGNAMGKATDQMNDLSKYGQPDQKLLRENVHNISLKFDDFSNFCESKLDDLDEVMNNFSKSMQSLIDVSNDFNNSDNDIDNALISVNSLIDGSNDAHRSGLEFMGVISNLPRLSKQFNSARSRVVRCQKNFLELIEQNITEFESIRHQIDMLRSEKLN